MTIKEDVRGLVSNEASLSRRDLLRGTAIAGASATLSTIFPGSGLGQTAPKRGGHIRIGMGHGSTTDTLNPAMATNAFTQFMAYSLRNNLTEVDSNFKIHPELAESWESSPDQKRWVFKLRPDIEFHNGKKLTADDVVATINFHRDVKNGSGARNYVQPITEVKKDDDRTVVITMSSGNIDLPYIFADFYLGILPSRPDGSVDWKPGIGSGPYKLKTYEPGVRVEYERNPNYWREDRAYFDGATVLTVADVNARTNALIAGEIHAMDRVDIRTLPLLARRDTVKIVETPSNGHYAMPMQSNIAPFDNNDVRLALKYGIEREAFLQTIMAGHGSLGNDHCVSRIQRFYARELPQRRFDPDKAKYHLRQAGMQTIQVPLHTANAVFNGAVDAAILFKEHAEKAGITIDVVREPNDGYWTNVWRKKPWIMSYTSSRPVEDMYMTLAYSANSPWNESAWNNPLFNKILVEARVEADESKRREMYVHLQRILRDEGATVIPAFYNFIVAMNKTVQHGTVAGNWDLDGYKALERWWFS